MRVYVGTTLGGLRALSASGALPAPATAHAVTPALRESYAEGDSEELEYAALIAAARDSLRALVTSPGDPRRRIVVAADVADSAVTPTGRVRSEVTIAADVALRDVGAVHVDDVASAEVVRAAADVLDAADAGDADAEFTVGEAEGCELMWFATQEIPYLLD